MFLNAVRDCVELCVDFFLALEKHEIQHCDHYSDYCKVCNPQTSEKILS